jgi:hypothetical protein
MRLLVRWIFTSVYHYWTLKEAWGLESADEVSSEAPVGLQWPEEHGIMLVN